MDITRRLLNLLLDRRYQLTDHALEALDDDGLNINDVVSCLSTGRIRRKWPRQGKYEVQGSSVDGRPVRLVPG